VPQYPSASQKMKQYKLLSVKTKKEVKEKDSVTTDPKTGSPLEVTYDYEKLRQRFNSYIFEYTPISHIKYSELYPIHDLNNVISLQEGGTPLARSDRLEKDLKLGSLYFKDESLNPSGSFKDRGSMVEITKAIELGAKAITLASAGNMAASVAAYAAKAGLPCYIFVPNGTPKGKLAQSLSFGAKVIQVQGAYDDAAELAVKVSKKYGFFLAGDYCFRSEGQKSIGYEIIEQLRWRVPDYVIVPVGVGTNISGIWKGFWEYKEMGLIDKLPKMIAVQSEGASSFVKGFNLGLKDFVPMKPNTICGGIAVANSLDGIKVKKLLKASGGLATCVSDEETLESQQELAQKESLFVEPSSATAIAALKQLVKTIKVKKDSSFVVVLTGHGLKDAENALRLVAEPPVIEPQLADVDRLLQSKVLDIRAAGVRQREKVYFDNGVTKKRVQQILSRDFHGQVKNKEYINEIYDKVKEFRSKDKKVTKADMQYVVEDVLNNFVPEKDRVLNIVDFNINVNKDRQAEAMVIYKIKNKEEHSKAVGVGPVDAAINALSKGLQDDGLKFKLTDYRVEINTKGTDAVVSVDMKLMSGKQEVPGNGTSPDIIQASIEAFENAYNGLKIVHNA
jgi:threonine synthase